jgi:hypothetical protein
VFGPSRLCAPLLWPRLTSARASSASGDAASCEAREQISQGQARDRRSIYPPHIRAVGPDDIGLRVYVPSRPPSARLVCGSCSSGRSFACGFLPTSLHSDAVADRLGVPVIEIPRGLTPPSHFPNRFRYRLPAPIMALRAMPGAHVERADALASAQTNSKLRTQNSDAIQPPLPSLRRCRYEATGETDDRWQSDRTTGERGADVLAS